MDLCLRPVHPLFGVEPDGHDWQQCLDDVRLPALASAVHRHGFLLLRDTRLADAELAAVARRFGPPLPGYRREFAHPDFPELVRLGNIVENGRVVTYLNTQGVEWHTDAAGSGLPPGVTLLNCVETPSRGGDTLFASTVAACADLPEELRRLIDGLRVVHSFDLHNDKVTTYDGTNVRPRSTGDRRRNPDTVDEIVQVHPATGARHLYVSHHMVREVVGMPGDEGMALIMRVVEHATAPRYVYRHRWRPGDLLIFDNRTCLHSATDYDYAGERRYLRQIIVAGRD